MSSARAGAGARAGSRRAGEGVRRARLDIWAATVAAVGWPHLVVRVRGAPGAVRVVCARAVVGVVDRAVGAMTIPAVEKGWGRLAGLIVGG